MPREKVTLKDALIVLVLMALVTIILLCLIQIVPEML